MNSKCSLFSERERERERERKRERERERERESSQSSHERCGRVVRWCWVNFQCRDVLLFLIIVRQGPMALAVGAGHFLSRLSFLHSFSLFGRRPDID